MSKLIAVRDINFLFQSPHSSADSMSQGNDISLPRKFGQDIWNSNIMQLRSRTYLEILGLSQQFRSVFFESLCY